MSEYFKISINTPDERVCVSNVEVDDLSTILSQTVASLTNPEIVSLVVTRIGVCVCCLDPYEVRGKNDPWEQRLREFCEDCAHSRCDLGTKSCKEGNIFSDAYDNYVSEITSQQEFPTEDTELTLLIMEEMHIENKIRGKKCDDQCHMCKK